jgi:PEP-CTERM/exosortase A-associated glycosyltransferase
MRVLHVLDRSLPVVAGYTSRAAAIFEHQAALGVEPAALTGPRQGGSGSEEPIHGVPHYRTPETASLARLRGVPVLHEAAEMAALHKRIVAVHREAPFDLFHAHSPILCGLPALAAARRLGVPCVYEIRAFWEDAAEQRGRGRHGSARYGTIRALETFLGHSVDALVTICEGLRRDLLARGLPEDRITVVPNGVDTARFAPAPRDEALAEALGFRGKLVVAYLGSLFRFEGVRHLLDALRRLLAVRDDVRGLVVGAGESEAEIRERHRELGLGSRVVLTGAVAPAEAARLYTLADVLVYPRERHRITDLVTPLKPLEGMSMGKLVVGSDVGGLRELIRDGDTGLLFRAGDPIDLDRVLHRAVTDASFRRRAGERARAYVVEHRDWRKVAARYADVYAAAAEARRRAWTPGFLAPATPRR